MSTFILSCESTIDLPHDYAKSKNIEVIRYTYVMDNEVFEDDMGLDKSRITSFYANLQKGKNVSTTLINQQRYQDYFEKLLKKSDHVLHIVFGSGLSSSIDNASYVATQLNKSYPNKHIEVIDSLCGSAGYGLLVDSAASMRDENKSLEEVKKWILENRLKIHHYIFVSDLSYLKKGGRVSATEAVIGNLLNICPLIYMDQKGKLKVFSKARGKKKVIRELSKMMERYAENGIRYSKKCYITHANDLEDAMMLGEALEKKFTKIQDDIHISNVGPVIGSHTGQGAVGLFFYGDIRPNLTKS